MQEEIEEEKQPIINSNSSQFAIVRTRRRKVSQQFHADRESAETSRPSSVNCTLTSELSNPYGS